MREKKGGERKKGYRKFNKARDEKGPKATKIRVGEIAAKKTNDEDSSYEICHYICCFRQRKVHLIYNVRY